MEARFWAKVSKDGPVKRPELGPCWEWAWGRFPGSGYGKFGVRVEDGRWIPRRAHRVAYELFCGPLPADQVVRHRCDHKPCVRPTHLIGGSAQDNADDMVRDGTRLRGESAPAAKLTKAQALEIIRLAADMGRGKYELLARRFGVSGKQIANICAGKRWPHLARTVAP